MGCGSSKSSVAVIENKNKPTKTLERAQSTPKTAHNLDHFQMKSSKTSLQKQDANNNSRPPSTTESIDSISSKSNVNKSNISSSKKSLRNIEVKKPSTASSSKSGDSGVYDDNDRLSSAKSRSSGMN